MHWRETVDRVLDEHKPPKDGGPLAHALWRYRRGKKKRAARRMGQRIGEELVLLKTPLGMVFPANMTGALVDHAIFRDGLHEPHTVRLLDGLIQPGDVVFDIGANVGFYTVLFSHLAGPHGKVFAFEPMTPAYWRLVAAHALNTPGFAHDNLTALPLALGAAEGTEEVAFEYEFKDPRDRVARPPQTVHFTTLDAFVHKAGLDRVDLLKVDVDGRDNEMLAGARDTIARFLPVLILEYGYLVPHMREVHAIVRELGYEFLVDKTLTGVDTFEDFVEKVPEVERTYCNMVAVHPSRERASAYLRAQVAD